MARTFGHTMHRYQGEKSLMADRAKRKASKGADAIEAELIARQSDQIQADQIEIAYQDLATDQAEEAYCRDLFGDDSDRYAIAEYYAGL